MAASEKRQNLETYSYEVPKSDQDTDYNHEQNYNNPFYLKYVSFTPSIKWGTGKAAESRALNTTHVDHTNEELVRTHHPAFSSLLHVCVAESIFGPPVWVVEVPAKEVQAGGRPIHYLPGDHTKYYPFELDPPRLPDVYNMHFSRNINPRRFLTSRDLDVLRGLFPASVGAEVLIAGFIIILFDRKSDLVDAYTNVWPLELAGLRRARTQTCTGNLGLKLRLPDGSSAITTVTHGFVKCPKASKESQIITRFQGIYAQGKASLKLCFSTCVDDQDAPAQQLTDSPIEKEVWLESSDRKVGTITRTYDSPGATRRYPSGYQHDLSLISDPVLPNIRNPAGYPPVTGWADYSTALEHQDVYVVRHQPVTEKGQEISVKADEKSFERVAVLGTGYIWNREERTQNAFILWRTGESASPTDGSPLCIGHPSEATSKAVVFQNFQRKCLMEGSEDNLEIRAIVKGGFVLPSEIRDSRSGKLEALKTCTKLG